MMAAATRRAKRGCFAMRWLAISLWTCDMLMMDMDRRAMPKPQQ